MYTTVQVPGGRFSEMFGTKKGKKVKILFYICKGLFGFLENTIVELCFQLDEKSL